MADRLAIISKALSDPIRLQILDLIKAGYDVLKTTSPVKIQGNGICVNDLYTSLELEQSKVSYHLRELKRAELIYEVKQGKWNFYILNRRTLQDYQMAIQDRFLIT